MSMVGEGKDVLTEYLPIMAHRSINVVPMSSGFGQDFLVTATPRLSRFDDVGVYLASSITGAAILLPEPSVQ